MRRSAPAAVLAVAAIALVAAPSARGAAPADGLGDNGLRSPPCRTALVAGGTAARDCATTGLAFAPAPIDHYRFDVHIDQSTSWSGLLAFVLQDIVLTPVWMALVWLVHAVAVALEWCFSIDLLDSATAGPIATALRSSEHAFTDPWLAAALAVTGTVVAYDGLVRRRVAGSLTDAATVLALIALGLWVIADPAQTVGRLDGTVNLAGLGAVAAFSSGSPDAAQAKFESGLGGLFAQTIQSPWCYLEFGDVEWCRRPDRLDPHVRSAAARIAARGPVAVTCDRSGVDGLVQCAQAVGDPAEARRDIELLRRARSNGDVFLALPAEGPLRNSVTTSGSLLTALCGAGDLATCRGPGGARAAFRGPAGTWARAGGLLFIVVGTAGMLALFAFLAMRLLAAALMTVLYLLLAPVVILSPAFGESGRAAFRAWVARLLGALAAKLLYAVLLGAVLLMARLLAGMSALGWWTEWLLLTAFWWLAFINRHHLLELGRPHGSRHSGGRGQATQDLLLARTIWRAGRGGSRLPRLVRPRLGGNVRDPPRPRPPDAPGRSSGSAPLPRPRDELRGVDVVPADGVAPARVAAGAVPPDGAAPGPAAARTARAQQVQRLLDGERAAALERVAPAADWPARRRALIERRERLVQAQRIAVARGDRREGARARMRLERLADPGPERAPWTGERIETRELEGRRAGDWLDAQARLRRGVAQGPRSAAQGRRDYVRLAPLAGVTSVRYERLDPAGRRRVRLAVDRELARRSPPPPTGALAPPSWPAPPTP